MKFMVKRFGLLPVIAFYLLNIPHATATDYSAGATLDVFGKYDSNIQLQEEKKEVSGLVAAPAIKLSAETETTKLALDSKFSFSQYDKSEYNTDDQDINLSSSLLFERGLIGLNAGMLRDSTVTSELLGSGRVGDKATRSEQYLIAPFGTLAINENNSLSLRSSYVVRDYKSSSYQGYDNWGSSLEWHYQLTERLTLEAVALYERLQYEDLTQDVPAFSFITLDPSLGAFVFYEQGVYGQIDYAQKITTKGGQLGVSYDFSELTSLSARFGRSRSKTTYSLDDPNGICDDPQMSRFATACSFNVYKTTITTAVVNWSWGNEIQRLQLNLTKSQQPTSSGYAIDATILSLNGSYSLTERNRLTLDLSGTRNRTLGSNQSEQITNQANRDYISAALGYHYRLSENWFFDTSYSYRNQTYKETDYSGTSNVISLGLSFHPEAKHWSR